MKNLKKMLAVVTASAAMVASVPVFAEVTASGNFTSVNGAVTADYSDIGENTVSASVDTTKAVVGNEMTFVILNNDVTETMITNGTIVADDILYIDQKTLASDDYTFTGNINLARVNGAAAGATELPGGSYPIRLGYYYDNNGKPEFAIATATMVVDDGEGGEKTITIKWGDIDGNGNVGGLDMSATLLATVGTYKEYTLTQGGNSLGVRVGDNVTITDGVNKATVKWGDIDGNGNVGGLDMSATLLATVGTYREYTVGGIDVTVGSNCEVIVPKE